MACRHPANDRPSDELLMECPDCGAECSGTSVGDDRLCYDERCPLHVLAGRDSLQIRLYPGDRERVIRAAANAGSSVSDYVRKRLGLPRKRAAVNRDSASLNIHVGRGKVTE